MSKVTIKNLAPVHTRTGRAVLDWTTTNLAQVCDVSDSTIKKFESGRGASDRVKLAMINALENAGVKLYNSGQPGARLMSP